MKKLIFLSLLFFLSCTRYVYIVIDSKGMEVPIYKSYRAVDGSQISFENLDFRAVITPNYNLPMRSYDKLYPSDTRLRPCLSDTLLYFKH